MCVFPRKKRLRRSWDETPIELTFGRLTEFLRPIAKFWWGEWVPPATDHTGTARPSFRWRLLSASDYAKVSMGRPRESYGRLQLMAQ